MGGHGGKSRRLRSTSVRLGAVAVLALGFAAACSSEPDEVCVDEFNKVVEDYHCDDDDDYGSSSGSYHRYYVPNGSRKPKVGDHAYGGSSNKSSVSRNGYGSSYRGGSGS